MYGEPLLSGIPCNNYYESNDTHDIIKKIFGQYLPWKNEKKDIYLKQAVNELNNIIFARYEGLNGKQKELMKKLVDILFTNKDKNDKIISDDDKKKNIAHLLNKECKEGGATEVRGGRGGRRRSVRRKGGKRKGGKRKGGKRKTRRGGWRMPGSGFNWCGVATGKCAICPAIMEELGKYHCPHWNQYSQRQIAGLIDADDDEQKKSVITTAAPTTASATTTTEAAITTTGSATVTVPVQKHRITGSEILHDETSKFNCLVKNLLCLQKCGEGIDPMVGQCAACRDKLDACMEKADRRMEV